MLITLVLFTLAVGALALIIWLIFRYDCKCREKMTKETRPNKMCIFDIDNTLTHGADAENPGNCPGTQFLDDIPPDWPKDGGTTQTVKDAIAKCRAQGYGIAIATAETGDEAINSQQEKFLKHLDPQFDTKFVKSPNFQESCKVITSQDEKSQLWCKNNEFGDKTAMYLNIMNYNGIPPNAWKESIVFDDQLSNLKVAGGLGFQICQASPQCGGTYCSKGCAIPSACLDVI